jgi:imidazole glycerol-phosphate synthase subunit HisH
MPNVAIIDYKMGNLDSVSRAVRYCGGNPVITNEPRALATATHIILPGVGTFNEGMKNLKKYGLDRMLEEQVVKNKVPFLGICLGMQLLATSGNEGMAVDGLNFIEGKVIRLEPQAAGERIPHVGWNNVNYTRDSPLFDSIPKGKDFYFIHSYHFACKDKAAAIASTPYCGGFVSAVGKENIFGVQFHPEKSQVSGFQLLKNFLKI